MGLRVIQDRLFQESSKCHTLEEGLLLLVWRCRSSELGIKRVPDQIRSDPHSWVSCAVVPPGPRKLPTGNRGLHRGGSASESERADPARKGRRRAGFFLSVNFNTMQPFVVVTCCIMHRVIDVGKPEAFNGQFCLDGVHSLICCNIYTLADDLTFVCTPSID